MKKIFFILIILSCCTNSYGRQQVGCLIGNRVHTHQINTVYNNGGQERYVFDGLSVDAITACVGKTGEHALHADAGPMLGIYRINCTTGNSSTTWGQVGNLYNTVYYTIVQCPLDDYGGLLVMVTAFSAFLFRRKIFG